MNMTTCKFGFSYRASHLKGCALAALPTAHECCRRPLTLLYVWSPSMVMLHRMTVSPNVTLTKLKKLIKCKRVLSEHGKTTEVTPPQLQHSNPFLEAPQQFPNQLLHVPSTQLSPGQVSSLQSKKSSLVMMMSFLLPQTWGHTNESDDEADFLRGGTGTGYSASAGFPQVAATTQAQSTEQQM